MLWPWRIHFIVEELGWPSFPIDMPVVIVMLLFILFTSHYIVAIIASY